MALKQINLRIEQELLKQMKAEAKQRGLSLNLLAASAFEQFLAGGGAAEQSAPKHDGLADVIQRLEVLERKLAKQEQQAHHLPHGPAPTAVKPPAEAKPAPGALPKRRLTLDEARGLLTSGDVCEALGLRSESSLTNWIARNGHDGAVGLVFKGEYCLLGKGLLPGGGKEVWLWQQV